MDKELKYLLEQDVKVNYNLSDEHIFIIGAYTDTLYKEKILVQCIKKLKEFNIPIILCTHFPVRDEIKQLVDYYIFDGKNELLYFEDTKSIVGWNLNDMRYIGNEVYSAHSWVDFHHDYAVLTNMYNGFKVSEREGKKKIHYIEYDNIIDTFQYYQTFLREIEFYDGVLYEYDRNSVSSGYCAAYLFSIRAEIASQMMNDITTIDEHFRKWDWRLENYILNSIRKYTNSIKITDYMDNNKTINICYIWNREILDKFLFYLVVNGDDLYLSFASDKKYLIEIRYDEFNKFQDIFGHCLVNIGKYNIDKIVCLKHMGNIFFESILTQDNAKYGNKNYLIFNE